MYRPRNSLVSPESPLVPDNGEASHLIGTLEKSAVTWRNSAEVLMHVVTAANHNELMPLRWWRELRKLPRRHRALGWIKYRQQIHIFCPLFCGCICIVFVTACVGWFFSIHKSIVAVLLCLISFEDEDGWVRMKRDLNQLWTKKSRWLRLYAWGASPRWTLSSMTCSE